MKTLFVDVILPLPLPQLFTYRVPQNLSESVQERVRVVVQFGRTKMYSGLVAKIHSRAPENYQAKYIEQVLDEKPIVLAFQLKFWKWLAEYYMCSLGDVLNVALPSGFKLSSETMLHIHPSFDGDYQILNDKEYLVAEALENNDQLTLQEVSDILGQKTIMPIIKNLIEKRVAISAEDLKLRYKPKIVEYIRFAQNYRIEDNLREAFNELARAPKQLEVLMTYVKVSGWHTADPKEIKKTQLYKLADASLSQVKSLIEKGYLEIYEKEEGRLSSFSKEIEKENELNDIQEVALAHIKSQFEKKPVVLLHGITSSGKTELYIHLAKEQIKLGKKVIYLVPEIGLTTQLVSRLKVRFGDRLGVYHSKFNENERVEIWNNAIFKDSYDIIIGARSTLFVPLDNLGLIIVDEEHENSYKQHNPQPRYHAKDAAIVLGIQTGAKVLLGSATPSIESYYNAKKEKIGFVAMNQRFGNVALPEIHVADLKEAQKQHSMKADLSPELYEAMKVVLERKEQVILFQNRRGFSPIMRCETCGWMPECKSCDITLTYHKYRNQLSCHYCGYAIPVPKTCGKCGSEKLRLAGFGTEKVEEDLEIFFPNHKVMRMDLDTTRNKNAYQRIIQDFEDGEIDVLIGTQMISKGLDFDNVSLVGILSADNMLSYPDFRAFEKSFQLMTQVAGRAGRKKRKGHVVIQAFNPNHFIIHKVVEGDYKGMVQDQLIHRKHFDYPPYSRMIKITLKHKSQQMVQSASQNLAYDLRKILGKRILGPETPGISRIRNLYLENILIKLPKTGSNNEMKTNISKVLSNFSNLKQYRSLRVVIDVDPL